QGTGFEGTAAVVPIVSSSDVPRNDSLRESFRRVDGRASFGAAEAAPFQSQRHPTRERPCRTTKGRGQERPRHTGKIPRTGVAVAGGRNRRSMASKRGGHPSARTISPLSQRRWEKTRLRGREQN